MSDLVARAKEFAKLVHGGKNLSHQKEIELLLKELDITQDEILLASVWLINILNNTQITYSTLKTQFGKEVADIVYGIPRNKENDIFGDDERSILLMLVDKVVTIESYTDNNSKEYVRHREQFSLFRKFLYDEKSISYPIIYFWYYLENLYRNEEDRLSIEELENIAKDIYSTNLNERETEHDIVCYEMYSFPEKFELSPLELKRQNLELDRYYSEEYQIVEEKMYDS